MEKARDISIVERVPSPLVSQAQPMPNAPKPAPLNAPFNGQWALNKALNQAFKEALNHAVSPWETHEKPPDLGGRETNSQCFLQYLMQPVATRLSALFSVTRISNSFAFAGETFGGEVDADDADAEGAVGAGGAAKAAVIAAWMMLSSSAFWAAVKHEVAIPIEIDVGACWICCRRCRWAECGKA